MKPLLVYIIAGEPSGDALGAGLMRGMRVDSPDTVFHGIGGEAMLQEKFTSLFPYQELSIMGFAEVLPHIPKLLRRIEETKQDIINKQPDVVITIDSPGFCFRLAEALKKDERTASIKRVHYVAPSVWAYKPKRAGKTARLYDLLLTLLPFEPAYFEKEGLRSVFVGHPVLWQPWRGDAAAFRQKHRINPDAPILLILPGSRPGEVKRHLDIFMQAARSLSGYVPVVLAGSLVKDTLPGMLPEFAIVADISEKLDAFAAAGMALSKSGTITLELAAAGVPLVVAHRVNSVSAWLVRRMIRIAYASLVNIAVNKEVIPEFIQERCTAEALTRALQELSKPEAQAAQRAACADSIAMLKGGNSISPHMLAAQEVLKLIQGK